MGLAIELAMELAGVALLVVVGAILLGLGFVGGFLSKDTEEEE